MGIDDQLDQFKDYMRISTNSSINTINKYHNIVRLFLLDTNMVFSLKDINRWISESARVKNSYTYKYAIKHFLISIGKKNWANSLVKVKTPPRKKVFKYISKKKMGKIINMLSGKNRIIAFLQLKTGARISEIITLRAENIDFEIHPDLIYIRIGVNKSLTKGSKERTLRLSKKYTALLNKWIKKPYGYLFLEEKHENLDAETLLKKVDNVRRNLDKELKRSSEWLGIELSSHGLRHVFADYFLKAGGEAAYLQKALGHSNISTTMSYVSIDDQLVDRTILNMEDD